MSDTVVIDIIAQVTDKTASGAASAEKHVSKLEKTMQKLQGEITKLGKMNKVEITMYAIDKASKVMNSVSSLGMKLAGKVFKITLKAVDLVTAPVRGIMKLLANPIVAVATVAGLTVGISTPICARFWRIIPYSIHFSKNQKTAQP